MNTFVLPGWVLFSQSGQMDLVDGNVRMRTDSPCRAPRRHRPQQPTVLARAPFSEMASSMRRAVGAFLLHDVIHANMVCEQAGKSSEMDL